MTKAASSVTQTAAKLNATVNPNGGHVTKCEFEYGETTSYGSSRFVRIAAGVGDEPGRGVPLVAGLTANTTYHFRISATNAGGTSRGADETVRTLANAPTVVTKPATSVTQTSATLNATVNPNGGEISECKFEYGETKAYGSTVPCTPSKPGSGNSPVEVSASVSGLASDTAYHFRISATNSGGTSSGLNQRFTTDPPTVVTGKASSVAQTAATLNASVNPNGEKVSKCEFEYGETTAYGKTASCSLPESENEVEYPVAVSASISGLTANTTYHFRISATNPSGTSKGADETFKTLPSLTVTTVSLPGGEVGTSYSQTLTASGGITPYSWSISSGLLPAGLSLNAKSGAITGTPSAAGTSSFTVKVTDSSTPTPLTATANLSITVTQPTYATSLTRYENGEVKLSGPNGVAVEQSSGNFWVSESAQDRVLEFNPARKYLRQFGEEGSGQGQFKGIGGIATNSSGDLYVIDTGNGRVQEFSPEGKYITQFATPNANAIAVDGKATSGSMSGAS